MASREEFRHVSVQDRHSIIAYLKAVTDGMERGTLSLRSEDEELELSPAGLVELEVRSTKKSGRAKLSLKLTWREDENRDTRGDLEIGPNKG